MTLIETAIGAIAGTAGKKIIEAAVKETAKKAKPGKSTLEKSIEAAMRKAHKTGDDNPQMEDFREMLFEELVKLIPDAVKQAKGSQRKPPRPALLRMLIRACR
jgi:hypothetical protein